MKVDFDVKILDLDRDEIPISDKDKTPVTLKWSCLQSICSRLPGDENLTGKEAFDRVELARRINKGGEQEITAAEAVLIHERAAKCLLVEVSGQVYELLKG